MGILGAFAQNNWNENRKENIQKLRLISDLKIELQIAKIDLASEINKAETSVAYGSAILEIVGQNNQTVLLIP